MSLFTQLNPIEMLAEMEAAGIVTDRDTCLDSSGKPIFVVMVFRGRDACKAADAAFRTIASAHPDDDEEGPAYRHLDLVCSEKDNIVPFGRDE